MNVNFQHLRAFYAVASDGSVTRAANRLGVSQPTLSKQVKALEDRYQVKLIEGSRPPLTLTAAGQALFERARRLFDVSADIEALLGETPPEEGGLLRVGTDSPPYAADLIAAYMRQSPNLDFKVTIANARETNDLLISAAVDIAIVCEPIGHNDYTYKPFYEDEMVAVVPRGWDVPHDGRFEINCLPSQVLLVRETTSRTRATMNRVLEDAGLPSGRVMEFHTREMIREAVAQGIGVTFMFARECPPDERLQVLPLDIRTPAAKITGYIACRSERRRHPAIRKAFEIAASLSGRSPAPRDDAQP
jgi:DNA-binding transcriptional LysR family regulator